MCPKNAKGLTFRKTHRANIPKSLNTKPVGCSFLKVAVEETHFRSDHLPVRLDGPRPAHVPIIDPKTPPKPKTPLPCRVKPIPVLDPPEVIRFRERTPVAQVNGRLKDEFGGRFLRVRGAAKVMTHLMFGALALTVDQLLRLKSPVHSPYHPCQEFWVEFCKSLTTRSRIL